MQYAPRGAILLTDFQQIIRLDWNILNKSDMELDYIDRYEMMVIMYF